MWVNGLIICCLWFVCGSFGSDAILRLNGRIFLLDDFDRSQNQSSIPFHKICQIIIV